MYRNTDSYTTPIATVTAPTVSYSNTGLAASTVYSYKVVACDVAGNCSAQSAALSVTTAASAPPATGLVGSWRFEEGSGGVAADGSGNGNVGTLRNGVSWAAGQVGGAIQLNGSTQDVVVADSTSLGISGTGLTLAAWIYPTQATAAGVIHKDGQYSIFRNANGSITYADSTTWKCLGSYAGTGYRFAGKLDEVQIFGRALSAQEIVDL